MVNSKQANSKTEEKSQGNGFNCCDGNFEEMFSKMQSFCDSKEKSFDCCEMMQQMFGKNAQNSQKNPAPPKYSTQSYPPPNLIHIFPVIQI